VRSTRQQVVVVVVHKHPARIQQNKMGIAISYIHSLLGGNGRVARQSGQDDPEALITAAVVVLIWPIRAVGVVS